MDFLLLLLAAGVFAYLIWRDFFRTVKPLPVDVIVIDYADHGDAEEADADTLN